MSYLSFPRLHFAGQFQADVPTVNNNPTHFDSANFEPSFHEYGDMVNGWWNPNGSGAWRFLNCTVQRVVYRDGTICDDPAVDPIVGATVNGAEDQVDGKVVDLDSENQLAADIFGFRVVVRAPDCGFEGDFKVAPFTDFWQRFTTGYKDNMWSAYFQSLLENVECCESPVTKAGRSRFLDELAEAGVLPEALSIKFVADGIDTDHNSPTFTTGRLVGAIGLRTPGEPDHFVPNRTLNVPGTQPLGPAYGRVDGHVLQLDLGNTFPTASRCGPSPALSASGLVYVAVQPPHGAPVLLSSIDYLDPNWYVQTGGIMSLTLTDEQLALVNTNPLVLLPVVLISNHAATSQPVPTPGGPALLSEAANGISVRADYFVYRLNPGEECTVRFYATKFGSPISGGTISVGFDPTLLQEQTLYGGPAAGPPVGIPEAGLTFQRQITINENGVAELTIHANDPGWPRDYIDGQVYCLSYAFGDAPPIIGSVSNASQMLNILLFSDYPVPETPTWVRDVEPIFRLYANLYPVMRPMVDLSNFGSVMARLGILRHVFDLPPADPNYMPVTRDLSEGKRKTIQKWLRNPLYVALESREDVLTALQVALELEHATIPPYLCAFYSIKEGCNVEVAQLIRSVVTEEMLHMALVANLIVALGGSPNIDFPAFMPRYPCSLPGGLRPGLTVRLRRCSIEHIRDVFMAIEEPLETVQTDGGETQSGASSYHHQYTIGWFYGTILKGIENLACEGKITFGNEDRQVTTWTGPGKLFTITSMADAKAAINEIMEQGEGRGKLHPNANPCELAHYYKFAEIVEGRQLVVNAEGYSYTGARIAFDPAGVWPMIDDPGMVTFAPGSKAQILTDRFAKCYQTLLRGLHRAFIGDPAHMGQAVGVMYSLSIIARELMQTSSGKDDGSTAGPAFQSLPGAGD